MLNKINVGSKLIMSYEDYVSNMFNLIEEYESEQPKNNSDCNACYDFFNLSLSN